MSKTIEIEPLPLSGSRFIGLILLSVALILSISTVTDQRISLKEHGVKLSLRPVEKQVYASEIPDVLLPETPAEPTLAPEPVVVVETPPPVVEEPVVAPVVPKPKPKPVARTYEQPTGDAKAFIYMKESGNHPCKINGGAIDCNYQGSRACGLGQALPCSKLKVDCPDLSDYACQDAWFERYVANRYGNWENARAFWERNRWW